MTTLSDQLVATPQREKGGSQAQDRFEFQTHWGVDKILELHRSGEDYAVAFEFHDDIVVLDGASAPDKIRFFQVKTRKGRKWSVNALTKPQKVKGSLSPSIISKMMDNHEKFQDRAISSSFVSNQMPNFIEEDKLPCTFGEADKDKFDEFINNLMDELGEVDDDVVAKLHYEHTDLPLDGYEDTVKGRLVDFVSEFAGDIAYKPQGFYIAVIDQCRKKSKELRDFTSFDDLKQAKFVIRDDVEGWLRDLADKAQHKPLWSNVDPKLTGFSFARKRAVGQQWAIYEAKRYEIANAAMNMLREKIRDNLDSLASSPHISTLPDVVEHLLPIIKPIAEELHVYGNDDFLTAAILYECEAL